jgi:hypothetical protein
MSSWKIMKPRERVDHFISNEEYQAQLASAAKALYALGCQSKLRSQRLPAESGDSR